MKILRPLGGGAALLSLASLTACSSNTEGTGGGGGASDACTNAASGIEHVILVVQENHTFDNHFGHYCTAKPGSNPTCNAGPACCEAAPVKDPSGAAPIVLDDNATAAFDPNHTQKCEVGEMNGGKMDMYVTGVAGCSDPKNFAVGDAVVKPYHDFAAKYAIADRYFQPLAGQSESNDMYLAVAKYVFQDNAFKPMALGSACDISPSTKRIDGEKTILDILTGAGKTSAVYAQGYAAMKAAPAGDCPHAPKECAASFPTYPCDYAVGDIPFLYYGQHADDPNLMHDYDELATDLKGGKLPNFSFVKALGFRSEHPGYGDLLSDGVAFVDDLVTAVDATCYRNDTLILVVWDEGGGYYDHVAPPADSKVDTQPYGTRVPMLALGRFAKKNFVSHVELEHSSVVKFLEWNFTGKTGQLSARDAVVNNLGSLLDAAQTGKAVPEN